MKQNDLNNSTQEEKDKTETTEKVKNETNIELDSKKKEITVETEPEKEIQEEKKESAADLILKKLKNRTTDNPQDEMKVVDKVVVEDKAEAKDLAEVVDEVVVEDKAEAKNLVEVVDKEVIEDKTEIKDKEKADDTNEPELTDIPEVDSVINEEIDKLIENKEKEEKEKVDYTKLSMDELVQQFSSILEQSDIQKVKGKIEIIKVNFYKKHHAKIDADKNKFVEDGGEIEEFKPEEDKLEEKFKAFYSIYKEKRAEYAVQLEKDKKVNLEKKYQ